MEKRLKSYSLLIFIFTVTIFLFPFYFVNAKTVTATVTVQVKKISLNVSNLYLELEQSYNLTVTFNPKNDSKDEKVIWTSSNPDVATVVNGNIYAKGIGTAYVYANCDASIAFCKITVLRYNPVRAVQNKNFAGYTGTDLETVTKAAEIIDKHILSDMTDEQKTKAIYDYLLSNCKYDYRTKEALPKSSYGIIGPLLKNIAADEGYSYTF